MSQFAEPIRAMLFPRRIVRALRQTQVQAWLMVLVLVVHALVQPRIAMVPRSFIGRETEHEVRLEIAWRGRAAEAEETRPARRARRSVSFCAELTARRPMADDCEALCQQTRRCTKGADLVNRNGTGGPLRC